MIAHAGFGDVSGDELLPDTLGEMSDRDPGRASAFGSTVRDYAVEAVSNRFVMWAAFVVVHLYLGLINLYSPTNPMGDVRFVYKNWIDQALQAQYWVGIDVPWVYPIVAIVPMLVAELGGLGEYPSNWLSMVLIVDSVALATLTGWGRRARNVAAGWWWIVFLVVLGPISLGRIDSISVPLAIIGVVLLAAHPIAATVVITLATWIKVWPAALIAALVIASRERRAVIASAIAVSLGIIAISLAFGSGANVLSFITEQTGRGLQVEAPISTFWMWQAFAGVPGTSVYYDLDILTFQVMGRNVDPTSAVMTPIMAVAVAVVVFLGIRAVRRGTDAAAALPALTLGFISCLIVFNKVGSPQYISWFAIPAILAILGGPAVRRSFRVPSVLILVIAGMTQVIYPFFYNEVLSLNPGLLVILTLRNLLLVLLLGWTVGALWRMHPNRKPAL